jgi:hypothetical protein
MNILEVKRVVLFGHVKVSEVLIKPAQISERGLSISAAVREGGLTAVPLLELVVSLHLRVNMGRKRSIMVVTSLNLIKSIIHFALYFLFKLLTNA